MEPIAEFEPATNALADLPEAARASFEPVTSTTQKAFVRLLRDMGGIQVSASHNPTDSSSCPAMLFHSYSVCSPHP